MKYIFTLLAFILPTLASAQDSAAVGTATGASGAPATPGVQGLVIQLGIIFLIFYVLLIRPQQKKVKAHTVLMAGLKKGDKVITGAGFVGTVTKATEGDKFVDVEIANGVSVKVIRSAITELLVDKKEENK